MQGSHPSYRHSGIRDTLADLKHHDSAVFEAQPEEHEAPEKPKRRKRHRLRNLKQFFHLRSLKPATPHSRTSSDRRSRSTSDQESQVHCL